MISVALPASLRRIASSTPISSNGFMDIFTLASSTPDPSGFTRILMSLSTTRLTGTRTFIFSFSAEGERDDLSSPRQLALSSCWSTIFSENRHPLFGIMLDNARHPNGRAIRVSMRVTSDGRAGGRTAARAFSGSPVLPGHPEHVVRTLVVGITGGDEQEVGQAIDVFDDRRRDGLAGLAGELDDQAFGAPADGAGEVQVGGRSGAARQHERGERGHLLVEAVDLLLQPRHLGIADAQPLMPGQAEIGAEIEQVVLNARQHGVDLGRTGGM